MSSINKMFKGALAGLFLAAAFTQGAAALEVNGVNFKENIKVAGKDLQLNGAGVRHKFVVKVYASGLYLPTRSTTVDEVMKTEGPRRMQLVMLRDITTDDFGTAFMAGINSNLGKDDKTRIVGQLSKMGEVFAMLPSLKKGDVLDLDWIPGTGLQCVYNGKQMGETIPDIHFYNAMLKIWLGEKPADAKLKPKLLGGK